MAYDYSALASKYQKKREQIKGTPAASASPTQTVGYDYTSLINKYETRRKQRQAASMQTSQPQPMTQTAEQPSRTIGDFGKALGGSLGASVLNVLKNVGETAEKMVVNAAGMDASKSLSQNFKDTFASGDSLKEHFDKNVENMFSGDKIANMISPVAGLAKGSLDAGMYKSDIDQSFLADAEQSVTKWADVENRSGITQFLAGAVASIPTTLLTAANPAIGMPTIFASGIVDSMEQYKAEGYDLNDPNVKSRAVWTATIEAASEYMFSAFKGLKGAAGAMKEAGVTGVKSSIINGTKGFLDGFMKESAESLVAPTVKNFAAFIAKQSLEEGAEEIASGLGATIVAALTTDKGKKLFSLTDDGTAISSLASLGEQFAAGALMGGVFSLANTSRQFSNTRKVLKNQLGDVPMNQVTNDQVQQVMDALRTDLNKPAAQESLADALNKGVLAAAAKKAQTNTYTDKTGSPVTLSIDKKSGDVTVTTATGISTMPMEQFDSWSTENLINTTPAQAEASTAPGSLPGMAAVTPVQTTVPTAGVAPGIPLTEKLSTLSDGTQRRASTATYQAKNGKQYGISSYTNGKKGVLTYQDPATLLDQYIEFDPDEYDSAENKGLYLLEKSMATKGGKSLAKFAASNVNGNGLDFYRALTAAADDTVRYRRETAIKDAEPVVAQETNVNEPAAEIKSEPTSEPDVEPEKSAVKAAETADKAAKGKKAADVTEEDKTLVRASAEVSKAVNEKMVESGKMERAVADALKTVNDDLKVQGIEGYYHLAQEKSITKGQTAIKNIVESATGKKVFFIQGHGENAVNEFVPSGKSDYIFVNVGMNQVGTAWAIGHGMYHTLANAGYGKRFESAVLTYLGMTRQQLIESKIAQYAGNPTYQERLRKNPDLTIEEVIADRAGELFVSVQLWETMSKRLGDKSLFNKITDKIMSWLRNVKLDNPVTAKEVDAILDAIDLARGNDKSTPKNIKDVAMLGNEVKSALKPNVYVGTQYAVLDASKLIASNDIAGNPNPDYDQSLQPRNRDRADSLLKISNIINKVDPAQLVGNETVKNGAPVIGLDGMVESGNGRVIGIKEFYKLNNASAQRYRDYITEHAADFGIEGNMPKNPVLVRIRTEDVDRIEFVRQANDPEQAAMSDAEVAVIDADRLTSEILSLANMGENGEINTAGNRDFIKAFIGSVIPYSEQGRYTLPDGNTSSAGINRIKNALFFKAYENNRLLSVIAEDTDSNIKRITNALVKVAPKIVLAKANIEDGVYHNFDISKDLGAAAIVYKNLGNDKIGDKDPVESYLSQTRLIPDDGMTRTGENLLKLMYVYRNSAKNLADFLTDYYNGFAALGNPRVQDMFESKPLPSREAFADTMIDKELEKNGRRQSSGPESRQEPANLLPLLEYAGRTEGNEGTSGSQTSATEARTVEEQRQEVNPEPDKPKAASRQAKPKAAAADGITDFGQKIGGARKDLWQARGLFSTDLVHMNEAEAGKYVKKDNIWKKADYQQMKDDGMPVDVIYYIKTVRDAIPVAPEFKKSDDTPEKINARREQYIDFVRELQDGLAKIKTKADVLEAFQKIMIDGGYFNRGAQSYAGSEWTEKGRANTALTGKLASAILMNERKYMREIESEVVKKGFLVEADKKIPAGYEVKFYNGGGYSSRNDWTVGTYYVTHGYSILQQNIETQEAAIKWAQDHAADKRSGGKKRFVPRQLEGIHRTGKDYRKNNTQDVTGDDYLKAFGFKGGEFGNWVNQEERRISLNYGYDALQDLADALGISPNGISLDGRLSIAFGARGQAGAAAHFEPEREVINLTKMNGAGSLAHEWGHALDYIAGKLTGSKSLLEGKGKIKEVAALLDAMNERPMTADEVTAAKNKEIARNRSNLEMALSNLFKPHLGKMTDEQKATYEAIKNKMLDGKGEYDRTAYLGGSDGNTGDVKPLSDLMLAVSGHTIAKNERVDLHRRLYWLESAINAETTGRKTKTKFLADSEKFGEYYAKADGYWQSSNEMFARAFACYVTDKLQANDTSSDYLSGHSENAVFTDGQTGELIAAIPLGEERIRINAAFDALIQELQRRDIFKEAAQAEEKYNVVKYSMLSEFGGKVFGHPAFYSPLETWLDENIERKMPPVQWIKQLTSAPFKSEHELEFLGIRDWILEQKQSITGAEILAYYRAHSQMMTEQDDIDTRLEAREDDDIYGSPVGGAEYRWNTYAPGKEFANMPGNKAVFDNYRMKTITIDKEAVPYEFTNDDIASHSGFRSVMLHTRIEDVVKGLPDYPNGVTYGVETQSDAHSEAQRPGGTGYTKSKDIALSPEAQAEVSRYEKLADANREKAEDLLDRIMQYPSNKDKLRKEYVIEDVSADEAMATRRAIEMISRLGDITVIFNDNFDGERYARSLASYTAGIKQNIKLKSLVETLALDLEEYGKADYAAIDYAKKAMEAGSEAMRNITPDIPYKKDYMLLGFKMWLRDAIINGHDAVMWSGWTHARRWRVQNNVASLKVLKKTAEPLSDNVYYEVVVNPALHQYEKVSTINTTDVHLENQFGKEVADKIRKAQPGELIFGTSAHDAEGKPVQNAFIPKLYDEQLPNMVNKYLRKWDTRAEYKEVDGLPGAHWVVEISNTMRDDLSKAPQVAYSLRSNSQENVKYSLGKYSDHQKDNWALSKNIVIYDNPSQLKQFITDAMQHKNLSKKIYFGIINPDLAERILNESGVNVNGYNFALKSTEILKIFRDHGNDRSERMRGQRAITASDFAGMTDVIQNPDSITYSGTTDDEKPSITFAKSMNGKTTIVTYVSDKHNDLSVQTMYIGLSKSNGNLAAAAGDQAPANTPEAHIGTVPNSNVSQKEPQYNPMWLEPAGSVKTLDEYENMSFEDFGVKYDMIKKHRSDRIFQEDYLKQPTVELITDATRYYKVKPNIETIQEAAALLSTNRDLATQKAMSDQLGDVETVLRFYFLYEADFKDKHEEAAAWAHVIAKAGMKAGRAVQAYAIFKQLSPGAQVHYANKELLGSASDADRALIQVRAEEIKAAFGKAGEDAAADYVKKLGDLLKTIRAERKDANARIKAAERLEERIKEYMGDISEFDHDAIQNFIEVLHGVATATMPYENLPKTSNPLAFMRWALRNVENEDMQNALNQAFRMINRLHGEDEQYMAEIEAYLGDFIPGIPKPAEEMNKDVYDQIKAVFTGHADQFQTFQAMVKRLIELGVDPRDAVLVAREAKQQISKLTKVTKARALKKILPRANTAAAAAQLMKLVNISNERDLYDAEVQSFVARMMGLPSMSPELANDITDWSGQIAAINQRAAVEGRSLTEDEQRQTDILMAMIYSAVQRQKKAHWTQKVDLFQSIMMMSMFKSAERNIIGNAFFTMTDTVKDVWAAGIDALMSKITGNERTVPMPDLAAWVRGFLKGSKESYYDIMHDIDTSILETQYSVPRAQVFTSKPGLALMKIFRLKMSLPDRAFQSAAYESYLNGLMKLNGVTEPTQDMMEAAEYSAQYKTFTDDNFISNALSSFRRVLNFNTKTRREGAIENQIGFGLGSLLIKFPRVPGALLMRTIEYSPISFFKGLFLLAKPIYEAKKFGGTYKEHLQKNQRKIANTLANGIWGTMTTIGMGLLLAAKGIMTGGLDDDKEKRMLQTMGAGRGYQMNWNALWRWLTSGFDDRQAEWQEGDNLQTYSWMAPMSLGFAIGANIWNQTKESQGSDAPAMEKFYTNVIAAASSGLDSITEMSVMSGLRGFMDDYRYSQSITEALVKSTVDVPSTFVPQQLKVLREALDNIRRTTYSDNPLQYAYNLVKNKLPGASKTLAPQVDSLGNMMTVYQEEASSGVLRRAYDILLNPAYSDIYVPNDAAMLVLNTNEEKAGTKYEDDNVTPSKVRNYLTHNGDKITLTTDDVAWLQEQIGKDIANQYSRINPNSSVAARVKRMGEILNDVSYKYKQLLLRKKLAEKKP